MLFFVRPILHCIRLHWPQTVAAPARHADASRLAAAARVTEPSRCRHTLHLALSRRTGVGCFCTIDACRVRVKRPFIRCAFFAIHATRRRRSRGSSHQSAHWCCISHATDQSAIAVAARTATLRRRRGRRPGRTVAAVHCRTIAIAAIRYVSAQPPTMAYNLIMHESISAKTAKEHIRIEYQRLFCHGLRRI